jgi:hypothetical protein
MVTSFDVFLNAVISLLLYLCRFNLLSKFELQDACSFYCNLDTRFFK